jgi:triphosphoribosyl-dephospho-CoA synthetase
MTTQTIRTRIEALVATTTELDDLLEALEAAARQEGADDLIIDLHDAGELTTSAVEFAVTNNGTTDPR